MGYGIRTTVTAPVPEAVGAVRDALATQGFGVLTEIDMAATLAAKLGVEVPPQVILGACNPPLAHRALGVDASAGLLLPCNVVVRAEDDRTVVEAIDPATMVTISQEPALADVADEAATRLRAALATLGEVG
ncbi:DUF302 domain-containing protein [Cellulomonas sp. APG4]|uniref:DUF302 domain-containing protein n=1 Tax=Cellulomonas sp. APG4 TaxID=1538656 RepID=UPI00137A421A|nr:DUF302 domain-containing protein [Cellulomonas sp. APG4]NCT92346.1 DUF302 domain-containing protein [Cellulomonas sp. APG4]